MLTSNVTLYHLEQALLTVNALKGYKLMFAYPPHLQGKRIRFRIRSERSKIHGASVSFGGRNSVAASWTAHGHFFECLLSICPQAVIRTAHSTIDADGGNWQDYSVGSTFQPMMASENAYVD